ncbi:MAG: hypothetical protein ACF8XB_15860, partial [Planctomycetota bacterium JB042]
MVRPARRPARAAALLALAALAAAAPPAPGGPAQTSPEPAPADDVPAESPDEEVRERRRSLQDDLAAVRRALAEATADGRAAPEPLVRSAETLERIDRTF